MSDFEERDWMHLQDLIHLIAKKLPDLLNFIRFRAVCKSWRSFAPLSDPPTQFPWLYEYPQLNDSDSDSENTRARSFVGGLKRFYSISSSETLTIPMRYPKMSGSWGHCMGVFSHNVSFNNYDYIQSRHCSPFSARRTLHLYNPLTEKKFALEKIPLPLLEPLIVWTGTDPLCNRNILIVDYWHFSECKERVGLAISDQHHKSWTVLKGSFSNAFLCQGILFTTYENGYTIVWDVSSTKFTYMIPPPDNEIKTLNDINDKRNLAWCPEQYIYIVESCEIILRVSWFYNNQRNDAEDSIFHIYRLQFDEVPCWIRLTNIGNQILFLEKKIAFSMSARPSTGFRGGCIYFISPYYGKPYVYDVLTGTIERVPVPFSIKRCSWFVPGI